MGVRKKALRSNRRGCHNYPSATDTSSSAVFGLDGPYFVSGYEGAANLTATAVEHCWEEQIEEVLRRRIDAAYKEVIYKIAAVYDEDIALQAVLRNGHCYGAMDVLTNIVDNAMPCIDSSNSAADVGSLGSPSLSATAVAVAMDSSHLSFSDIRHLEEYCLAGMTCLLQEIRPNLRRMDAMWCLLMCDLNVSAARKLPAFLSSQRSMADGPDGGTTGNGDFNRTRPYVVY